MDQSSRIRILEDQLREFYGRIIYTHKTHEKCADMLSKINNRNKITQIFLSTIITSGIFFAIFGELKIIGIITAIFSLVLTIINAYLIKFEPAKISEKHSSAAIEIWNIREKYLSLLTDLKTSSIPIDEIIIKRDSLQKELYKVYKGAPRTNVKAYNKASNSLKHMQEMTFQSDEIDNFLPENLRRNE